MSGVPTGIKQNQPGVSSGGASPQSNYDQYGGWLGLPIANSSGYFRSATVDGRSWLVTPAGHAFFSTGVNLIAFGAKPFVNDSYDQRMFERYRNNPTAWANDISSQLLGWGFNTIGGFSGPEISHHGLTETRVLGLTGIAINPPYNTRRVSGNFADVFDPHFATSCSQIAGAVISPADITDPWIVGYFLDNELYWFKQGTFIDTANGTLVEDFIALPRDAFGKQAWVNQLIATYSTIDNLNVAWGTSYTSFSGSESTSLLNVTLITAPAAVADKNKFLGAVAEQYYSVTSNAVRGRDPNHLILSDRFVGVPIYPQVAQAASNHVDVISLNLYDRHSGDNPSVDNLDFATEFGKPALISEYSFRAVSSGLPNNPPVQAPLLPTDRDRAEAYQLMLSEATRRPYVVGAHWFMHADRAILNTSATGGYYGHHNWGLVDINNAPYPDLTTRAASYNTNVYYHKLGQPAATLPPPTPLNPMYAVPVFTTTPTFSWRAVVGATAYRLHLARTPDFAHPIVADNIAATSYTPPPGTLTPGRWYWRVRATGAVDPSLAFTTPQPFFVLTQTASLLVTGFETLPEVTIQGQGPDYRWTEEVNGDISMVGSQTIGVTQGLQSGLLTFSGQTQGVGTHYSWANMNRYPRGSTFTPRNWTGYNYFSLDLTFPGADKPAPFVGFGFSDDAGRGGSAVLPIRSGTTQVAISIDAAIAAGMNPTQMADFGIGLRRPLPGMQLAVDNAILRQVARQSANQPAVTVTVTDARTSGTLLLDWRGYQPAPTTTSYLVYVSDSPSTPITSLTPTLQLDAVAQSTMLRCQYKPGSPGADPDGFNTLANAQTVYIRVVAVDFWGNVGVVGNAAAGTPSECGISFNDVPPSYWAFTQITDLACLGIVEGGGGGVFSPHIVTTRDQFAKMITLARAWPLITPPNPSFSDVQPNNIFYSYIETANANHALTGASAADCRAAGQAFPCFLPHNPITRVQIAVILVAAFGWALDTTNGPHFTDVPPTAFGYAQVETCYNRGVINGIGNRMFGPNQTATRDQVTAMLYNALRQFRDVQPNRPLAPVHGSVEGVNP